MNYQDLMKVLWKGKKIPESQWPDLLLEIQVHGRVDCSFGTLTS